MKYLLAIFLAFTMSACAFEDRVGAQDALESMGFTEIKLYPAEVFLSPCSKGDGANNPFTAKNAQGKTVKGTVCCGGPLQFKGCTVRF